MGHGRTTPNPQPDPFRNSPSALNLRPRRPQVLISAVQSSIRGGLLFARKSLHWANEHGYIHLTAADSYLDETVGFTFALLGFYTQWQWGFALPFPFNVIMFPFSTVRTRPALTVAPVVRPIQP